MCQLPIISQILIFDCVTVQTENSSPGVQFVHPSVPLVKRLENVPREQGNNELCDLLLCIILNPEPIRAEVSNEPSLF